MSWESQLTQPSEAWKISASSAFCGSESLSLLNPWWLGNPQLKQFFQLPQLFVAHSLTQLNGGRVKICLAEHAALGT